MNNLFLISLLALSLSCKSSKPVDKPPSTESQKSPLTVLRETYGTQLITQDSEDQQFTMAMIKKNENNFKYLLISVIDNRSNVIVYKPSQRVKSAEWVSNEEIMINFIPGISIASGDNNSYIYNLSTQKQKPNE
ncbi:MAG: hypothetical protein RIA69_08235 [Cyclobacteriaceae bacterium]